MRTDDSWRKKPQWNNAKNARRQMNIAERRGELVRKYKALHGENFFSTLLTSDEKGRVKEDEETSRKRKAGEEIDGDCVGYKRACFNFSSSLLGSLVCCQVVVCVAVVVLSG